MKEGKSVFTRYRRTALNTPVFRMIEEVLATLFCIIYWLRWQLSRPLYAKIVPKWMPRLSIPGLMEFTYITYGEVLLALPLILLTVAGYYYIFAVPEVELSGDITAYAIIIAFLAANKSSSLFSFVFGIPFERMLGFHKLAAVLGLAIGAAHTNLAFQARHGDLSLAHFAVESLNNTLGTIIFIGLAIMVITSFFPFLRRWNYEIWFWTHICMAITISVPYACHSVNKVWLPVFWFVIDLFVRYVIMAHCYCPESATIRNLRGNVVEVRFKKPRAFQYNPGQFVRIAVPKLTAFQFHPFSLSSAPHEEYVTLHIRVLGDWTKKLMDLAGNGDGQEVRLLMEGPYGSLSVDLTHPRYGMVLCVSGGIGVTQCRSVTRSLVHDHFENGDRLHQLRFVWAIRGPEFLEDIPPFEVHREYSHNDDPELAILSTEDSLSDNNDDEEENECDDFVSLPVYPSFVKAEVYVTSDAEATKESTDSSVRGRQCALIPGRPNLDKILSDMRLEAIRNGVTHIAALGCGPRRLTDALRESVRRYNKGLLECHQGVTIDLHVEIFEF